MCAAWSIGQSLDDLDAEQQQHQVVDQRAPPPEGAEGEDDSFWNLTAAGGEVPLSAGRRADLARDASSENLLKEDNTIHK